ncbi:MAG: hypothetical protein ACJ74T_21980 [Pyrinomonadaceae bacterium]
MSLNRDDDVSAYGTVAELFPHPISFLFTQITLNASDAKRATEWIRHTVDNSLRYLTMLVAAEYASFPGQDDLLNRLLDGLNRPSLGHLHQFVWRGVKRLDRLGHQWFVGELPGYVKSAGAAQVQTARGLQNLTDCLVNMRNIMAHDFYETDWSAMLEEYRPRLNDFLRQLRFLADYKLCRFLGEGEQGRWVVAELMGARRDFPEKMIDRTAGFEGEASGVFLLRRHPVAALPLHPFVIVEPCRDCARQPGSSGEPEEVFLLNGADGEMARFIGVRHKLSIKDPGLAAFRRRKNVWLPRLRAGGAPAAALRERAAKVTSPFIDAQVQHGIYLPEVYVPRRAVEDELEKFLVNERAGFLLLGESGIGKTSLLCHTASRLAGRSFVTLYYPAADLDFDTLEEQILSDLALEGTLDELLDSMGESGAGPLVLIIDGVNEHPHVSPAVRRLNDLVNAHPGGRLKVVFSLRTFHFRQVLDGLSGGRFDPEGESFFSRDVYHTARWAGGERETYQHVLARLRGDSPELAAMYEGYRALGGVAGGTPGRRFRPLTSFENLSRHVRDLISNPWHMRLVLEIYHEREVPARIFSTDLMHEYCQRLIYDREGTANFAEALVDAMCELTTASLTRSQMEAHPALKWFMTGSAYDAGVTPFGRLIEDGVLVEYRELVRRGMFDTPTYRVQFAFDRVLEFLIANLVWSRGEPDPKVIQMLLSGSPEFAPFGGAVQVIWTHSVLRDGGDLILRCADECDGAVLRPLVSTLRELEAHGYEAYSRILAAIAASESLKSALLLMLLGEGMSVENGVPAQNRVFEELYRWRGEHSTAFRFLAGKALMFGYLIEGREGEAVEVYNQVQRLYSEQAGIATDLLSPDGALTRRQKERINAFARLAEQCGIEMMARAIGLKSDLDEMLARLHLEHLPEHLRHDLALVISLNAHFEAAATSEASMRATERLYEAERSGQAAAGLRAFDDFGLNLSELIIENLPKARERIETELGFICQTIRLGAAGLKDSSKLLENVIRVYLLDARAPIASLAGRLSEFGDLVNINLIIANSYKARGNEEKRIEHLLRAKDYAAAWEATEGLVEVYRLLMKAAEELGDDEAFETYAKRYLIYDAYVSLSEDTKAVLLKDDPFALFVKHVGADEEQAARLHCRLEDWCADALLDRCQPWLATEEQLDTAGSSCQRSEVEAVLSRRVFNYDKLRKEQRVIEVIDLLLTLAREKYEEAEEGNQNLVYHVQGRLLLMSMLSEWYRPPGQEGEAAPEPSGTEERSNEFEQILEELRESWSIGTTEERMRGVAVATVFPAFVPLTGLEEDAEFCAALGKRAGTNAAMAWVRSVMKCWCSDVMKGRRAAPAAVREYLKTLPGDQLALNDAPHLVFTFAASFVFWERLQGHLSQELSDRLKTLSESADNIEAMIDALRGGLPSLRDVAAAVVLEAKDELRRVHEALLAEFE